MLFQKKTTVLIATIDCNGPSELETFWAMCQFWKLYGRNFFGGNFLAGNFLSHVVIFGNLMTGNFLGGNFLGGHQRRYITAHVNEKLRKHYISSNLRFLYFVSNTSLKTCKKQIYNASYSVCCH